MTLSRNWPDVVLLLPAVVAAPLPRMLNWWLSGALPADSHCHVQGMTLGQRNLTGLPDDASRRKVERPVSPKAWTCSSLKQSSGHRRETYTIRVAYGSSKRTTSMNPTQIGIRGLINSASFRRL
jgi:hypothetical protein